MNEVEKPILSECACMSVSECVWVSRCVCVCAFMFVCLSFLWVYVEILVFCWKKVSKDV